jgi:hypothetical protein
MPVNGQVVKFNKKGGKVSIEFIVGQAQWGRFRAILWDQPGHKHEEVGQGMNTDQIPDIWDLPVQKAAQLDGRMVSWEVAIGPLGASKGQLFSLSVRLSQDGNPLPGGVILETGALGDSKFIFDFVTLEAA